MSKSPLLQLHETLLKMPPQEDDQNDKSMQNLKVLVEESQILGCTPEELMDARRANPVEPEAPEHLEKGSLDDLI